MNESDEIDGLQEDLANAAKKCRLRIDVERPDTELTLIVSRIVGGRKFVATAHVLANTEYRGEIGWVPVDMPLVDAAKHIKD